MLNDFKNFALKGNVIDMAIGVIVGTAFGQIVNSLVADILMPPLSLLTGGVDFAHFAIILKEATASHAAVTLNIGHFVNTILDFLVISFSIFFVLHQLNKLQKWQLKMGLSSKSNTNEPSPEKSQE